MSVYRKAVESSMGNKANPEHPRFLHQISDQCVISHHCVPVVVIDPEDMSDVEEVRDALWRGGMPKDWQAALRSLVAEPEPEEPMGLGAVALDSNGDEWVRTAPRYDEYSWCGPDNPGARPNAWRHWNDIPRPLTVLSPGWEPEQ